MKITEMKSEVSIDSGCANSLTNRCVQNSPENQLAIVSAEKDHTSVKDRVMEAKSEAVRGLIFILPTQKSSETPREVVLTTPSTSRPAGNRS